jgi:hypothetical protein
VRWRAGQRSEAHFTIHALTFEALEPGDVLVAPGDGRTSGMRWRYFALRLL